MINEAIAWRRKLMDTVEAVPNSLTTYQTFCGDRVFLHLDVSLCGYGF